MPLIMCTPYSATLPPSLQRYLFSWGTNEDEQLGREVPRSSSYRAYQVDDSLGWVDVKVQPGSRYVYGIRVDGTLWASGPDTSYPIGNGEPFEEFNSKPLVQIGTDNDWAQISCGSSHILAIKEDATLWAWGNNDSGQLGLTDPSMDTRFGWIQVTASGFSVTPGSTIGIRSDNTLWAFGNNNAGQLGLGDTDFRSEPIQVGVDSNWISVIASANFFVFGLKTDGTLWAWGNNSEGQLGLGDTDPRLVPTQVGTDTDWLVIGVGYDSGYAIKTDGTLWAWGNNSEGQLGLGDTDPRLVPTQVGTDTDWLKFGRCMDESSRTVVVFKTDNTIWSCGDNIHGQLGLGDIIDRDTLTQVGLDSWQMVSGAISKVAIKMDGSLWTWGSNSSGQLGLGAVGSQSTPQQVGVDTDWISVASGTTASYALKSNQTVWTTGYNFNGQLGLGDITPRNQFTQATFPSEIDTIHDIYGGQNVLYIISDDVANGLYGTGTGFNGQASIAILQLQPQPEQIGEPTQIGTDEDWSFVSAGGNNSFAIKADGTLWGWGRNQENELGIQNQWFYPVQVGSDTDWEFVHIEPISGESSFAIKTDSTLWATGNNQSGQLGFGNNTNVTVFTQVGSDTDWIKVSCGGTGSGASVSTIALKDDNTLWTWGYNENGELGHGDTTTRLSPTQVGTDTDWIDIFGGYKSSAAIKSDNTLWISGIDLPAQSFTFTQKDSNTDWSVGDHTTLTKFQIKQDGTLWAWGETFYIPFPATPILVTPPIANGSTGDYNWTTWNYSDEEFVTATPTGWSSIHLSGNSDGNFSERHTMGLKQDGSLWAWGNNRWGQLGTVNSYVMNYIADTEDEWIPETLSYKRHGAIIKQDGTLWTWGNNSYGQLGLGDSTRRYIPTQVGTDTDWSRVSCGGGTSGNAFTVAIKEDGTLWMTGSIAITSPVLMESTASFIQLGTDEDWLDVSAGDRHFIATKSDGSLWAMGMNDYGQLGIGDPTPGANIFEPTQADDSEWEQISAGSGSLNAGIKADGTLWVWGGDSVTPTQVGTDTDWAQVSCNGLFQSILAVKADGTLWARGGNAFGQLGLGDTTDRLNFTQVGTDTDWAQVSLGCAVSSTLAVKTDGTLWAWGNNNSAQLGFGFIDGGPFYSPTQVGSDTDWASVNAGLAFTIALKTDNTLWGWGSNGVGQLGLGNITHPILSPTQVGSDTNWVKALPIYDDGNSYPIMNDNFTIALKNDGTVWLTGRALDLSPGTGTAVSSYIQLGTDTDWVDIAVGVEHVILKKSDGTLWAFGQNDFGQLGLGTGVDELNLNNITQIGTADTWGPIFAQGSSSYALDQDGTLWSWGYSQSHRLAIDLSVEHQVPLPAQVGTDTDWDIIATSSIHSFAIKQDGTLWSCGSQDGGIGRDYNAPNYHYLFNEITTVPDTWTRVSGGVGFAGGITSTGQLYMWGANSVGQLGLGNQDDVNEPTQVGTDTDWENVSCGEAHTVAVKNGTTDVDLDGTLYAWGDNRQGALGQGEVYEFELEPIEIPDIIGSQYPVAGYMNTVLVTTDGQLFGAGAPGPEAQNDDSSFAAGLVNSKVPNRIGSASDQWSYINVTDGRTFAIKSDGTMWRWGAGFEVDELTDNGDYKNFNTPTQIGADTDWSKVSVAPVTNIAHAIKTDGTLWGWGDGGNGDYIGLNDSTNYDLPQQIGTDTDWIDVQHGADFTIALKSDGTIWGCGPNYTNQLGTGDEQDSFVFIQIGTDTDWQKIVCGAYHTIALKSDGTIWGWGTNENGELGQGDIEGRNDEPPIQIGSDTDWVDIFAGDRQSCALKSGGQLWVWGNNENGQIGNLPLFVMEPTLTETGVLSISTSFDASAIIKQM